jgi:hypothetical protein
LRRRRLGFGLRVTDIRKEACLSTDNTGLLLLLDRSEQSISSSSDSLLIPCPVMALTMVFLSLFIIAVRSAVLGIKTALGWASIMTAVTDLKK